MDPQLVDAVRSIARSLQAHGRPTTLADILQLLLVLFTGGTVWFLWRYTKATFGLLRATRDQVEVNNQVLAETVQLRKATQDQVEINNKLLGETIELRKATQDQVGVSNQLFQEAHNQREQSAMPIVVLTTTMISNVMTVFIVKNIGSGPALNTRTSPVTLDQKQALDLHHRTVIGAGEYEEASFFSSSLSGPLRLPDLVRLLNYQGAPSKLQIFVQYQGVNGSRYQTSHTLMLTTDQKDLRIEFDKFEKIQ
jgi:hypothetical protein